MIPAVIERCAGIDVGRKFVVVCVMVGQPVSNQDLEKLRQWLHEKQCTHVVIATAALRRRSNLMPITVPNYNRKTDRLQFGTPIDITSES